MVSLKHSPYPRSTVQIIPRTQIYIGSSSPPVYSLPILSLVSIPTSDFVGLDQISADLRSCGCPIQFGIGVGGVEGMGNGNGREGGAENGSRGEVLEGLNRADVVRVASADLMASTPPHDDRDSRAPVLFSPHAPAVSLQRNDGPSNPFQGTVDLPHEQGIPKVITWSLGGNNVAVEGYWDNWNARKVLQRSGKDHSILLVLPLGIFRYKFIVDGEVRCIPDFPSETDDSGHVCNLLDVHNLNLIEESPTDPKTEMELEKGVQRWAIDISHWNPSPHEFSLAMSLLPQGQHASITRFVKFEDQKRAIVSRLLQNALVNRVLGIPFGEIVIERTLEGKPYLVCDNVDTGFPNFNFNVSHHGHYVAIASEPICLVGLDIVSHSVPVDDTAENFIQSFFSYFAALEWNHIFNASSSDEKLKVFYRYWCLKEAFVKAMGSGLGYKLDDVEFHHTNWDNIFVKVAGNVLNGWKFWILQLGENHSVAVARGHPRSATNNYMRTLQQIEFDDCEYNLGLHLPNPSFTFLTVDDLIQSCHRSDCIEKT